LKTKKFLLVCYFYPPFKAVGSFRSYYIAEELVKEVDSVTVLTSKSYSFFKKQDLKINSKIKIKRCHFLDPNVIRSFFAILKKNPQKQNNKTISKSKSSTRFLSIALDTFPINVLIGEGGFVYIVIAIFRGLFSLKNSTHIYSSFRPYSDHFVAYILKLIKPSLFWIADFRDPHLYKEEIRTWRERYQNSVNKRIFRKANIVTTVSEGYKNSIIEYNSRCVVIPNGINKSLEKRFALAPLKQFNKFTISHVGSLYNGRRDPSFVFNCLAELIEEGHIVQQDIQLLNAGPHGNYWYNFAKENRLESCITDLGVIAHKESISVQKSSHLNLMLTWATKSGGTFPAKFFEYLVAKVPILLVVNGERDVEFEAIFNKYRIGLQVYNQDRDKIKLKAFLMSKYLEWKTKSQSNFDSDILNAYRWENKINDILLLE